MPEHPSVSANAGGPARASRRKAMMLVSAVMLSSGCLYGGREKTDETVKAMAERPYDQLPEQLRDKSGSPTGKDPTVPGKDQAKPSKEQSAAPGANSRDAVKQLPAMDVQTVAYMEAAQAGKAPPRFELTVPEAIPGSEAPPIKLPTEPDAKREALDKLYPPLPPLESEVKPLPGPDGKPYTLSDLQRIAAENSPTLRQAASDVQAAIGNLRQTETYKNPTVSLQEQASNNNSTGGAFGFTYDQVVSTAGKMKMQAAAAKKSLDNAELALKRARSDLATQVRNAYYAFLVAKETMRVTRALSVLTDEVYRVQLAYTQNAGQSASYEPAALRAQAWTARLAHKQAIASYVYSWKILVSAIGERQLPLSEVSGRIDAVVPKYEYDRVLAHILRNHTDALTAINGIDVQKYNLKVNQVSPYFPDLDFNIGMFKDRALFPFGTYATFGVSAPLPIWDQNRGNILQAEAALARSLEEPHRVELALTSTLSTNFTNYLQNLEAVEYYKKYILPDQVRAYRGTLLRRQIDINAQFGDLIAAQQTLATGVTTYLGLLGTLWTSVISVADMLQTDDLFQTAEPKDLPEIPNLDSLPPLPCCHPFGANAAGQKAACPTVPAGNAPVLVIPPAGPPGTPVPAPGPAKQTAAPVVPMPMPPAGPAPKPLPQNTLPNLPMPLAPTAPGSSPQAPATTLPATPPSNPNIPAPRPLPPMGNGPATSQSSSRTVFTITDQSLAAIRGENVPESVVAKLYPLKDKAYTPGDFMSEIARALSADEARQYHQMILNNVFNRAGEAGSSGTPTSSNLQRSTAPSRTAVVQTQGMSSQSGAGLPRPAMETVPNVLPPRPAGLVPSVLPGGE